MFDADAVRALGGPVKELIYAMDDWSARRRRAGGELIPALRLAYMNGAWEDISAAVAATAYYATMLDEDEVKVVDELAQHIAAMDLGMD